MSEASYMEVMEWGDQAYEDFAMYDAIEERETMGRSLIGKYVIVCDGVSSKKQVYLQDRSISKGGYWTQYISNARSFETVEQTKRCIRSIRYNAPRIALVDGRMKLVTVYNK